MAKINEGSLHSAEQNGENRNDNINAEESYLLNPSNTTTYSEEIEILREQFQNYLIIAQALLKTLKRPRDIEICTMILRKVGRLNDSNQTEIKRNNNYFFRYCLRVLKWTSENQPLELYRCWYPNQENSDETIESRAWLEANKSHIAFKLLKDGSTVIYCAIAADPSAGWQDGGLNILAKRGMCFKKP